MFKSLERYNPLTYKSSAIGDFIITVVNGFGVITGVLILYGLIARVMGLEALGEFLLVRRTTFELLGVFLVGINLGLPYYISKGEDRAYGVAAMLLFMPLTIPLIGLVAAALYLGVLSGFPRELALPFFIFSFGYALQLLAYALLRGYLNMLGANILQLTGTGIIPIIVFVLFHDKGIPPLPVAMGLGTIVFSAMVYLIKMGPGSYVVDWPKVWQLLTYGVQRVPGLLAQFILIGGVPLLILSQTGKADIAFVNSGISLIRLFLVVVGPVGIVLLPRLSKALAANQKAKIAGGLEVLGKTTFLVGVTMALFLSMNSATLLNIWLGNEGVAGAEIVRLIVLGLPFYLLIVVLRSPIDAASARGYNSLVYGAAALVLLVIFYGLKAAGLASVEAGVISFIAGHLTGAVASLYYTHKLYGIRIISTWYLMTVLGAIAFSFVLVYSINALVSGLLSLLLGGIALLLTLGLFFLKSRSTWIVDFRSLVMIR